MTGCRAAWGQSCGQRIRELEVSADTTFRGRPSTSTTKSAAVKSVTWRPSRSSTVTSRGSTSTPARNTGGCSGGGGRRPGRRAALPGPAAPVSAAPGPAASRRRGEPRRRWRRGLESCSSSHAGRRRGRRWQPRRREPAHRRLLLAEAANYDRARAGAHGRPRAVRYDRRSCLRVTSSSSAAGPSGLATAIA